MLFRSGQKTNYRDIFPIQPRAGEIPDCADSGVLGVLPGVIGSYMAAEAIKVITGVGTPLSGRILIVNLLDQSSQVLSIPVADSAEKKNKERIVSPDIVCEINLAQFKHLQDLHPGRVSVIDVRELYEFEEVPTLGINIPLYELHMAELPADSILVFICQSGLRSRMAVQVLKGRYKGEMYSLGTLLFK